MLDAALRQNDATGERFLFVARDRLDGIASAAARQFTAVGATCGYPLVWRRATPLAGVSAAGYYPTLGDGLVDPGSTTGVVQLDAGATFDQDMVGLRLTFASGALLGQTRLIRSWTSPAATVGPGTATEGLDLPSAPAAGDQYHLAVDAEMRSEVWIAAEFSAVGQTCVVAPVLMAFPRAPSSGATVNDGVLGLDTVKVAPRLTFGSELVIRSADVSFGVAQAGYVQGYTVGDAARGAHGVGVYLVTPPQTGSVSLWVATV